MRGTPGGWYHPPPSLDARRSAAAATRVRGKMAEAERVGAPSGARRGEQGAGVGEDERRGLAATAAVATGTTPAVQVSPIAVSPRVRLVLIVVVAAALVWLLRSAPAVPRLLLAGGVLALVLSFPVRLLARRMPRKLAILLVVAALLVTVGIALPVLIVTVIDQLTELAGAVPGYAAATETWLRGVLVDFERRGWIDEGPDQVLAQIQQEALTRGETAAQWLLGQALGAATGTIGTLIQLFGVIFVAVYLLADFGRFTRASQDLVPGRYGDDVAALWWALDESLSRYLGGLLVSITIQAVAVWVALSLLDVQYPLLLGLWMAVTAVLPYVGAFLGAIPAIAAALFVSPLTAVAVAFVYLAINQVEGNLLTPRIQGSAVRVHPLLIFLAVIAGGEIAGLLGAALAVPAVAIGRVVVDFFAERLYVPRTDGQVLGALSPPRPALDGEPAPAPAGGDHEPGTEARI